MKFGSVCSGIEAASVAFEPLGWKAAWFSEIEPFPCAVLKHHYPNTPNHGDMTTLPEKIRSGEVEAPDLFCGGTPCQAFSVAGLRQSLSDDRGNLSLTFCEIANAIDHVRSARGEQPCIVFWENVPGVLSTTDNAFGCFLGALSGCDSPILPGRLGWTDAGVVAGSQRTVAWRVLDAQYFGLAQRRRRVFVVSSARDGFNPAEVLLEFQGLRRDFAPSREAGERSPGCAPQGLGVGGELARALTAANSATGRLDPNEATFVTHSLRGEGFDASEDGTGRGTPLVPVANVNVMPAMMSGAGTKAAHNARSGHTKDQYIVPVAFAQNQRDEVRQMDVAGALAAEPGAKQQTYIAFHPTQDPISSQDVCHAIGANENATAAVMRPVAIQGNLIGREAGGPQGVGASQDGVMYTLTKMDVHGVAQAVNIYGGNKCDDRPDGGFYVRMGEETSKTLDAASGLNQTCSQGGTAVLQPIAVPEVMATLLSSAAGFSRTGGSVTEHETYIPMAAYPAAQKEVTLDNTHAVMQSTPFGVGESPDLGHCLRSGASKADKHESTTYVTQVIPIDTMNHIGRGDAHSFGDFQPGAPSYTLTKHHSHAVAFTGGVDYENNGHDPHEPTGPLLKGSPTGGGRPLPAISLPSMQVRRLTPVECERLQGFPDGYTAIPWRGKPTEECPDGPRYKALGNSWAVPCVQWIGRRIQQEVQGKVPG